MLQYTLQTAHGSLSLYLPVFFVDDEHHTLEGLKSQLGVRNTGNYHWRDIKAIISFLLFTKIIKEMQLSNSSSVQTLQPVQYKSVTQVGILGNPVAGLLVVALPAYLVLGIVLYRKCYRAYRVQVLVNRIERLERMWHINFKK